MFGDFDSTSDEGGGAILDDLNLLSAGYLIVLVFVTLVMGRFNMIQHKVCFPYIPYTDKINNFHLINSFMFVWKFCNDSPMFYWTLLLKFMVSLCKPILFELFIGLTLS